MADYALDTIVRVHPFDQHPDGEDVIIGDPARDAYLCIPADGLHLLESLAAGHTVGEAVRRYRDEYGQTPDIDDFLRVLADEGFVAATFDTDSRSGAQAAESRGHAAEDDGHGHALGSERRGMRKSWSFDWISPAVAARLCSAPVLIAAGLFIALGLGLAASDPHLLPTVSVLMFPHGYFALLTVATLLLAICAVMVHEVAHAVVARSLGLPARLAIGNLMYTMVAQTDITGIWMAPKRKRYLAFLSGTIVDLVAAALIIDLLYADRRGWIGLNQTVVAPLLSGFLFTYGARISFQLLFYLRTDIYYVVSTAMSCKNLMSDTETLLRNLLMRALRRPGRLVDQSTIPGKEMKRVRAYAVFYAVGRVYWIGVLAYFYLPLLWGYLRQFVLLLSGRPHRFGAIDFLTVALLAFAVDGGGLLLWLRSLYRERVRPAVARSRAPEPTLASSTEN